MINKKNIYFSCLFSTVHKGTDGCIGQIVNIEGVIAIDHVNLVAGQPVGGSLAGDTVELTL